MTPRLELREISLHFGGVHALSEVSLDVPASGVNALIGPNGAGKTSLVNIVTGAYTPTAGRVIWDGEEISALQQFQLARRGIARTFQNLQIFWTMSVLENVTTACQAVAPPNLLAAMLKPPFLVRAEKRYVDRAMAALEIVGLAQDADRSAGELPYGHLKHLEIARALALDPRLLLLDEPAAGCTAIETRRLGDTIRDIASRGTGVLLIEHDMKLVMAVSDRITVLDSGRVIADGSPEAVRGDARVIEAYLGPSPVESASDEERREASLVLPESRRAI